MVRIKKRYWLLILLVLNGLSALMLCFHQQIHDLTIDRRGNIYLKSDIAMSWGTMIKKMDTNGKTKWMKLRDCKKHDLGKHRETNWDVRRLSEKEILVDNERWRENDYWVINSKTVTIRKKLLNKYDIVKLTSGGIERWRYRLPNKKMESVGGMAIDQKNNFVIAVNTRWGYSIVKLNPKGRLLWRKNINPKKSMIWVIVFVLLWIIRSGIKLQLVGYAKFVRWLIRLKALRWGSAVDVQD